MRTECAVLTLRALGNKRAELHRGTVRTNQADALARNNGLEHSLNLTKDLDTIFGSLLT